MKKSTILLYFPLFLIFLGCGTEILISPLVNGAISWVNGEAHKYYSDATSTLYRASKRSLLQMELTVTRDDEPLNKNYYFIAGKNNRFKIKIKKIETNVSKLSVRINFMGDKDFAELFYKKVNIELNIINFDKNGNPTRK